MRVLLFPNTAASMVWFRQPFLRKLVAAGHRVWVAAPEDRMVDRVVEAGVTFLPMQNPQGWSLDGDAPAARYVSLTRDLGTAWSIYRACRLVEPDVVLAYTAKMSVLVPLPARAAGVSAIHGMVTGLGFANLGGNGVQAMKKRGLHAVLAAAAKLSSSLILLNPDNVRDVVNAGWIPPKKVFHMDGEGVDTTHFDAPAPAPSAGALTFLMVARLVRYKGVYDYAEAAAQVQTTHPNARFLLAGGHDPNHPDAVPKATLDAWRDEGTITLTGHVDDIRSLYAEADVFVLPSAETEGLPVSILEAMAMRRPILTTAVPGNRETVHEGTNGFLVDRGDVAGLVGHMRALLDHPASVTAMGEASRARVEARFDHRIVDAALLAHLQIPVVEGAG